MNVQQFIGQLNQLDLALEVKKGKLVLKGLHHKMKPAAIQAILKDQPFVTTFIQGNRAELVKYYSSNKLPGDTAKRSDRVASVYPLSPLQEGMLFHSIYEEATGTYINQFSCDFYQLDERSFAKAWGYLQQNHTILRSAFFYKEMATPFQVVYHDAPMPIERLDFTDLQGSALDRKIQAYLKQDRAKGFDLGQPPLMRASLLKVDNDQYKMVWTNHHIISDGWSFPLIIGEFLEAYQCYLTGKRLPIVPIDKYEDYIKYLRTKDIHAQQRFWEDYLADIQEGTLLPFVDSQQERNTGSFDTQRLTLRFSDDLKQRIQSYATEHHLTVNTIMQAAWSILLSYYTGKKEVVYGVTVSGRPTDLPNAAERIGLYINTIPLCAHLYGEEKVIDFLTNLQHGHSEAREYQHSSLADIRRWKGLQGEFFDSILVFENYPTSPLETEESAGGVSVVDNVVMVEHSNYLLSLVITNDDALEVLFKYNSSLLATGRVQSISQHFELLVHQLTSDPKLTIAELNPLTVAEYNLIEQFNDTAASFPKHTTVLDLISATAQEKADETALIFAGQTLSYGELDKRANQVAWSLIEQGVKQGDIVGICLDRSFNMLIGLLGIWKAGGAYLPIDPNYPQERMAYLLKDTATRLVLCDAMTEASLPSQALTIRLEGLNRDGSTPAPVVQLKGNSPAYIIYTSGSTGRPKGVLIDHAALFNRLSWAQQYFALAPADTLLQKTHFCFDVSVWELFWPLMVGARLVVAKPDGQKDMQYLQDLIKRHAVTTLHFGPAALEVFLMYVNDDACKSLQRMMCGGEPLRPTHVKLFDEKLPHTRLYNLYGPTETTINVSCWPVPKFEAIDQISIGHPIANTKLYVMDEWGRILPPGLKGELHVAGPQLAVGYLNRPGLTHERFVIHQQLAGQRLYATGDIVLQQEDGSFLFFGRKDDQVKIRGYRIELGEIEKALMRSNLLSHCVVLSRPDQFQLQQLVVYYVAHTALESAALEQYLSTCLPEYMIPRLWVSLSTLPLNRNGKVDRKALPELTEKAPDSQDFIAASSLIEETLLQIWKDLLGVTQISVRDNFFVLGGHSLLAMRMLAGIRKHLKVDIPIRTIFEHPTIATLARQLDEPRSKANRPILSKKERPVYIPLSYAQERLWFIDQYQGSQAYHVPSILPMGGAIDEVILAKAFKALVERHEILRTVYYKEQGIPYQRLLSHEDWTLTLIGEEELGSQENWYQWATEEIAKPFDLGKDYMLRACLLKRPLGEHILVLVMHHIATDAWSNEILIKELLEFYTAFTEERVVTLQPLAIQYADFALWEREYLSKEILSAKLNWWKERLRGAEPLDLPTDFARPAVKSSRGGEESLSLSFPLSNDLKALSAESEATLFISMLALLKVLLYRYCGQADICVGAPVTGRNLPELEPLIGFFINNIVLRTKLSGQDTFANLLARIQRETLEAYDYQDAPFDQIVEAIGERRDNSRNPLFQVLLSVNQEARKSETSGKAPTLNQEMPISFNTALDLHLSVEESASGLSLSLAYSSDLFKPVTIKRMLSHFEQLCQAVVDDPNTPVGKLRLFGQEEAQQLQSGFNATQKAYPLEQTVLDLFEEKVNEMPKAIAVEFQEQRLTFHELNKKANQVANFLQTQGVETGSMVALCLERGMEMLIGMLGILKVGGIYIPIDPELPEDRVRYLLLDSGTKYALTDSPIAATLPQLTGLSLLALDQTDWQAASEERESVDLKGSDLVYVIYTSGSTGLPKGVLIEHRGLANLVFNQLDTMPLGPGKKVLQFSSISFDAAAYEIFVALASGSTLIIPDKRTILSANEMGDLLKGVDFATLPTSYQQFIEPHLEHLSTLVSVGEALDKTLGEKVKSLGVQLFNGYGPTENTIATSISLAPINSDGRVSIGNPFSNVAIYLFDELDNLIPIGVIGELVIGGAQVARGYLNQVEKSHDHFTEKEGMGRLYRSGDLAKRLPNGELEFVGRKDDQVKIRGYRIELGEIEKLVNSLPYVNSAVVIALPNDNGQKQLVGYIVFGDEQASCNQVNEYLRQLLPEYMIPTYWEILEYMSLIANGKADKQKLPRPDFSRELSQDFVPPRSETENKLAIIWQELLQVEKVGVLDNFFDLGGHSLLATRVIAHIERQLNVTIDIKAVFAYAQLAELAAYIDQADRGLQLPALAPQDRAAHIPLSFAQERLWFVDRLQGSLHYHIPMQLQLNGPLDVEALEFALRSVIQRHEILRTVYAQEEEWSTQRILSAEDWQLFHVEAKEFARQEDREDWLSQDLHRAFDLTQDYMMRARLLQYSPTKYALSVVVHHIAADGWSLSILVEETLQFYYSKQRGETLNLPPLAIQYADFAIWQRKHLTAEVMEDKLKWWAEHLQPNTPLQLPTDFSRPERQSNRGAFVGFEWDLELSKRIKAFSKEMGATLFMTLLSAFKLTLYRYSRQQNICVGTPVANRPQQELEGLIGFFINTLALQTSIDPQRGFRDLLETIKSNTLTAYANQDVPFEQIVEHLDPTRDLSRSPLFQAMFVLNNNPATAPTGTGDLEMVTQASDHYHAKYDLTLAVSESEAGLELGFIYCADLFQEEMISRMARHLKNLIHAALLAPDEAVGALRMLDVDEEERIIEGFNNTRQPFTKTETVVSLFESFAKHHPVQLAVVSGEKSLSYQELDERTNAIAHFLKEKYELKIGDRIGLMTQRSEWMIIGLLAIIKTGAAYVPIDPRFPIDRKQFIAADTQLKTLLTDRVSFADLAAHYEGSYELLEGRDWSDQPITSLATNLGQDDLLYLIYTSGSTGKPKGVLVEHASLLNYVFGIQERIQLDENPYCATVTDISTDLGNTAVFAALCLGGTIDVFSSALLESPASFFKYCEQLDLDLLKLTPSLLAYLLETEPERQLHCRNLLLGGEALSWTLLKALKDRFSGSKIFNHYGPTETTIGVLTNDLSNAIEYAKSPPIGKPIPNTSAYILDENRAPLPIGVIGTIYLGGAGVARGYHDRPQLTGERFLTNPFTKRKTERMYDTGDLGYWLPDGQICYAGRADHQVKIRGYRVELGEIEHTLQQCELVERCIVLCKQDQVGENYLLAYVVPRIEMDIPALNKFLQEKLPTYMIPARWIRIDKVPMTANMKVDHKALPDPGNDWHQSTYLAPRNALETQLVEIFNQVLQVEQLSVSDDFFKVGGHSLSALRVVLKISKVLDLPWLNVMDFFNHPTVAGLAEFITHSPRTSKQLTPLNRIEVSNENLFLIPPILGLPIVFNEFAKAAQGHLNAYGFRYKGIQLEEDFEKDIPSMAKTMLPDLLAIQQTGTFHLLGYSIGALVAFELSVLLEELGHTVNLVLVDRDSPGFAAGLSKKQRRALQADPSQAKTETENIDLLPNLFSDQERERIRLLYEHNHRIGKAYRPTSILNSPILALEAADGRKGSIMQAWAKLTTSTFEHQWLPGQHDDLFHKAHIPNILPLIYERTLKVSLEEG